MGKVPDDLIATDVAGPMRDVRVQNAPGLEAFGGGQSQEQTTQAIQGVQNQADKNFQIEKMNGDDAAVQMAYSEAVKRKNNLLYSTDPKSPGALTTQGTNALGVMDQYTDQYKKEMDDIRKNLLHNPEQQKMFDRIERSQSDDMNDVLEKHQMNESQQVKKDAAENAINAAADDAVKNYQLQPDKVKDNISLIKNVVTDQAMSEGKDPAPMIAAATSKVHSDIIKNMLANGQDQQAQDYFKANTAEIQDPTGTLAKALEEGSVRGESQRQADSILSKTKDRTSAIQEADKIEDPKVRDMTVTRIDKNFNDTKKAETQAREDNYMKSAKLVDENPDKSVRDIIPPDTWNNMTPSQQSALEKRSSNPQNDSHKWLDFISLGSDDLKNMSKAEFETKYWADFDSSHRARAEKEWEAARTDGGSGDGNSADLSHVLSFNQRVQNTFYPALGLSPDKSKSKIGKEEANEIASMETEAARQIQDFETQKGSKSNGEEQQKILDGIAIKRVFVPGMLGFGGKEKPVAALTTDEAGKSYVPIDKIPAGDLSKLKTAFEKNGKKPSDDDLEQAYGANLTNDADRFHKIIGISK